MDALKQLQQKYPDREFQLDEYGRIGFVHEGMFIVNPLLSECGRFEVQPQAYCLSWLSAMVMVTYNQCVEVPDHVRI